MSTISLRLPESRLPRFAMSSPTKAMSSRPRQLTSA